MESFIDHFRETFNGWWDELGQVHLVDAVIAKLVAGMEEAAGGKSVDARAAERDRLIVAMQKATKGLRE